MAETDRFSDQALLDHLQQFTSKSVSHRLVMQLMGIPETARHKEIQQLLAKLTERQVQNEQL